MIGSISMHSNVGREIAWNYYKKNHDLFVKKYQSGLLIRHLVTVSVDCQDRCCSQENNQIMTLTFLSPFSRT